MSTTTASTSTAREGEVRRVVLSSFVGSVVEYYDFLLYATASALVFNQVFFSQLDPVAGTVASLGTFATGYLARPLGGVVFGHFGDTLGRKKVLVVTMVVMAGVSVLIGLLPTSAQIGAAAPVLLVVLRVLQGVAVGGEWGGAVLMSAEHAGTRRRGLLASFTNAGAPAGMVLSTAVMAVVAGATTDAQFLSWGWRVPFLLSAVLLAVGLWIRVSVSESPVFQEAARRVAETGREAPPLVEVLRRHARTLLVAVGVGFGAFVVQGTLTTYTIAYAVGPGGFDRGTVLGALTISSAGAVVGIPLWAALTDRVGRRPVLAVAGVALAAFAFALFPMIRTGEAAVLVLAVVLGQSVLHAAFYGPLAALLSELFASRLRYTGASLCYQLAGVGAGLAPVTFAALTGAGWSTTGISALIAACCLLSTVCVLVLRETRSTDLARL